MTGRTHDVAALSLLAVVVVTQPIPTMTLSTALLALLANQLGGIAPDIDQPTAPFWRNLPVGGIFGRMMNKMLGGHRFLTHSILGAGLLCLAVHYGLVFLHPVMPHVDIGLVWWAFIIGVVSHLIMDSFTKEGVPWLLPIPVKLGFPPFKKSRITTGKSVEKLIIFPALMAFLIWLCATNYVYLTSLVHRFSG